MAYFAFPISDFANFSTLTLRFTKEMLNTN